MRGNKQMSLHSTSHTLKQANISRVVGYQSLVSILAQVPDNSLKIQANPLNILLCKTALFKRQWTTLKVYLLQAKDQSL